MRELTDLEMCKRIAEIEGVELFNSYSIIFDKKVLINMYMDKGTKWHHAAENEECFFTKVYTNPSQYHKAIYNPLTDNSLCFSLMLRHEVSLTYGEYAVNAEILIEKEDGEHSFSTQAYCPSRAICLAIIMSKVGT
jgi:hypothetical protein